MIKYEVINIPLKRMNGLIFPGFSSQRLVPSRGRSPLWRFLASGLSSNNYLNLDYLLTIAHLSQLRFSVMGFRWLEIYIWLFTSEQQSQSPNFKCYISLTLIQMFCSGPRLNQSSMSSLSSSQTLLTCPSRWVELFWYLNNDCDIFAIFTEEDSSATDCKIDFQSLAVTVWHQDKLKQNDSKMVQA